MNKIMLLFAPILVSGFLATNIYASPPVPAPKCFVKGTIEASRFEPAHEAPCVKQGGCPTDTQLSYKDTFYLSVKIQSADFREGDTRWQSCADLYPLGSTQEIFITKDKVKSGDLFSQGRTITGTVINFGVSSFETYDVSQPSIFFKLKLFFEAILNSIKKIL